MRACTESVRSRSQSVRDRTPSVKHRTLSVRDRSKSVKHRTVFVHDRMPGVRDRMKCVEMGCLWLLLHTNLKSNFLARV